MRYAFNRQCHGREVVFALRNLCHGDFGSHHMLKIDFSNFLMITY
jgi:hypothetical protein